MLGAAGCPPRSLRGVDGLSVWDADAEGVALQVLNPGVRHVFSARPDVLVVGGGTIGLATAVMCRRAGLGEVLVVERNQLASGPSGRAAGILAPEPHAWSDPAPFVDFGRRSLRLTREVDADLGGSLGLRDLDCVLAEMRIEDAAVPVAAAVDVLDGDALRTIEPAVAGIGHALLIHAQSRVHPLRFAAGFARHCGVAITGVEVGALVLSGESVIAVETSVGVLRPGVVVFATGTAPRPYVTVPHYLVKGHLATTEAVPFRVRAQVVTPRGGALQLDDGRLLTGGTLDEGDFSPKVRPEVIAAIQRGLVHVIPAAASTRLSHAWCCFRPTTPDRLPIVDRVPDIANAWFTSGHYRTGLLMAVATGEALARWIMEGTAPSEVEAFSLARFN